jgi:CHAT domain-containing protein
MKLGRLVEAEREQQEALKHEQNFRFGYWQMLTMAELGDVRLRSLGGSYDPANPPPAFAGAAEAYAGCIYTFERVVASCVLPVARAVEQQLMRSYADNAIELAVTPPRPGDLVAAIEAFGPRYANDLVSEAYVAAALDAPSYARFRQARAIVHKDLATLGTNADFDSALDAYLADIIAHRAERRYYLEFRNTHSPQIAEPQYVHTIVKQMLALRIPNTWLLLVNVERLLMHLLLVDASTGRPLKTVRVPLTSDEWHEAHRAYAAVARTGIPDPAAMQRALEVLVDFYSENFSPELEPLANAFEGGQLKIFPRSLMNQVPLHAVRIGNRPLIDICDVSYAPSLTLFLQVNQNHTARADGTLTVLHDVGGAPFFAGTIRAITAQATAAAVNVPRPSWRDFQESLRQHPTSDIVFGCHGHFDSDRPDRSRLEITRREHVEFAQMFAELDLRGRRSVLMGACESGLGRTLVSAEYIGLPMAFLAAGVPYVIGALWEVAQLPAAILVADYCALLLRGKTSVPRCLNEAQRHLKTMSRTQVMAWVREFIPDRTAQVEGELKVSRELPFAHPYYWSGFYVSGDV